jgi:EmrB/QacA subfamily drug resistance transporter
VSETVDRRVVLLIASLAAFLTPFEFSAVNVALPTIGRAFSAGPVLLGWVATAYLLSASVFLLPFGRLSDIQGRKKNFVRGVILLASGSLLCSLAPSMGVLILCRILQGAGGAMLVGTGTAMIAAVFPLEERGRALGLNVAATYTGLSIGPFLGGLMTQHLGWRSLFYVNVPLGILILVLVGIKLRDHEWKDAPGAQFDWPGAVIYGIGLIALMYGFSNLPAVSAIVLVAVGVIALVGFVLRQLHTTSPLFDIRLFAANRAFAFSNLAALVNYSATAGIGMLLSLYLQYNRQLSAEQAGLVLVAQPVVMALLSPLAGRLSDRVQPRIVASVGMGITTLGLLVFAFLGPGTPLAVIVFTLVLHGLGFALFSSPNTNAVMSAVERPSYGVAAATLATMRSLGQMFSLGIAMLAFSLFIGHVKVTPENASRFLVSARYSFAVFAGLCLLGVFASLARGKRVPVVNDSERT